MNKRRNLSRLHVAIRQHIGERELFVLCNELLQEGHTQAQLLDFIGYELQNLPEDDDYDAELLGISSMLLGHCRPQYSLANTGRVT